MTHQKILIYKKWYFWFFIVLLFILLLYGILKVSSYNTKRASEIISNSSLDFIAGIENANSHLNDFSYNYETNEVEYKPSKISLDSYNSITEGMSEDEVIKILGPGEKNIGSNTYMISWGALDMSDGYIIQIIFSIQNSTVLNKSQIGLN